VPTEKTVTVYLVSDDSGIRCLAPTPRNRVNIASADTAVRDLDIDISFLPGLGVISLPFHVAIGGVFVKAAPAFELGFAGHVRRLRIMVEEAALVRRDGDGRMEMGLELSGLYGRYYVEMF
jgi:hypothetical protein